MAGVNKKIIMMTIVMVNWDKRVAYTFRTNYKKERRNLIHFVIMVYPAVSKFYLGPYLLGGKRGSEAVRHHDLDGSTLSLVVFSHFYAQNYKKV